MPIQNGVFLAAAAMAGSLVCAAVSASATTPVGYDPEMSVRVGTLGIGPEIGIRIPDSPFGVRGNLNIFSYNDSNLYSHRFAASNAISGYDLTAHFDGSLRLLNGGLTLDYYPLGTGLRLSAGVYGNGNRITALAMPNGTARIDSRYYPVADAGNLSLKALVNDVAPYVGFGYASRVTRHLIFAVDAGMLVEGDPRVSITTNGPAAGLPVFRDQIERERQRIQNDIDIPVYPVLMLGFGYQF